MSCSYTCNMWKENFHACSKHALQPSQCKSAFINRNIKIWKIFLWKGNYHKFNIGFLKFCSWEAECPQQMLNLIYDTYLRVGVTANEESQKIINLKYAVTIKKKNLTKHVTSSNIMGKLPHWQSRNKVKVYVSLLQLNQKYIMYKTELFE